MKLRRRIPDRIEPRGVTPRRLAAAERALTRERAKLALFAQQVLAEQESAEERIDRMDQSMIAYDQGHRDPRPATGAKAGECCDRCPPNCRSA